MEHILLKSILSGLFIYIVLLIFYVEFRDKKHTDYPSGLKTLIFGSLLILAVILFNLYKPGTTYGPVDYGMILAGLLIILSNRRTFRILEKGAPHVVSMLSKLCKININKFLLIIIILSVIIVGLQYIYNLPLKLGPKYDLYEYLACVREIANWQIPPHSALTAENVSNQHYGPYIVILGYIYAFSHINPAILFYLAGLVNVFLFIFFSFKLIKEFFGERIAFFSVFSMLFLWGVGPLWAGVYAVSDGYDYFYTQGVAYTLLVASFYFLIKAKHNHKYIIYCLISSFLLFTTHLLTGFFYFFMVYLYIISGCITKKPFFKKESFNKEIIYRICNNKERNLYYIFALCFPLIVVLLSLLWPYYSIGFLIQNKIPILSALSHSFSSTNAGAVNFIAQSTTTRTTFGITAYLAIAGVAIAGVIGLWRLLKIKQLFFPILFICCFAILILKIVPFSWRFIFFSMIPLHIGFGILIAGWYKELKEFKCEPKKIMIVVIIILLLLSSVFTVGYRIYSQDNIEPLNMEFIGAHTNSNEVILTDGVTGFAIPGLTGRKIVYPTRGSMFMTDFGERGTAIKTFFDTNSTEQDRTEIINRYNVSCVLINKELKDIRLPYLIEYEDDKYLLYRV